MLWARPGSAPYSGPLELRCGALCCCLLLRCHREHLARGSWDCRAVLEMKGATLAPGCYCRGQGRPGPPSFSPGCLPLTFLALDASTS